MKYSHALSFRASSDVTLRVSDLVSGQGEVEPDPSDHARGHELEVVARGLQDDHGGGQGDEAESDDKNGFPQSESR